VAGRRIARPETVNMFSATFDAQYPNTFTWAYFHVASPCLVMDPRSLETGGWCGEVIRRRNGRFAAENVQGAVIPHSGHWVMEENPTDTMALVIDFLTARGSSPGSR